MLAAATLAACQGRQDAYEPKGNFPVTVPTAQFPTSQTLSEHTRLVISVHNAGNHVIPNVAVTICNVTCAFPSPPGEGTEVLPFSYPLEEQPGQVPGSTANPGGPAVSNPSRPMWIVDRPPGECTPAPNNYNAGYSCQSGGAGSAVTASPNTWAMGRLGPGETDTFDWEVTAVHAGHYVLAWEVGAGLYNKAHAVSADGSPTNGTFSVNITGTTTQPYVNNAGQIVGG